MTFTEFVQLMDQLDIDADDSQETKSQEESESMGLNIKHVKWYKLFIRLDKDRSSRLLKDEFMKFADSYRLGKVDDISAEDSEPLSAEYLFKEFASSQPKILDFKSF